MRELNEVVLSLDGLEALRLADADRLDQTQASALMGISRPTFSRLLQEARFAVATALSKGSALRIGGGPVVVAEEQAHGCFRGLKRHGHRHGRSASESECVGDLNMEKNDVDD